MKRRTFLGFAPLLAGGLMLPARAQSAFALTLDSFGVVPDAPKVQTTGLQAAIDEAAARGLPLFVPAGIYRTGTIRLPANLVLTGIPGATLLILDGEGPLLSASGRDNITLDGIGCDAGGSHSDALLAFSACHGLSLTRLAVRNPAGNCIGLERCAGAVENCTVSDCGQTGIHAQDSAGLTISSNSVSNCANGGIRVWRYESGRDGTLIANNRISGIASQSGNGQNGNGINVFRADEVIITGNSITDCDFSAIRVNATTNSVIGGNVCSQCREVAIFSEFAFSGSVISGNIIDEAAAGISMTNFDQGGHLATCTGNIVRNIWARSPTNPENGGFGIAAEADAAITGNTIETVAGTGIVAGWGPYLRDVSANGNVVRDTEIGIGVSVVKEAGKARITGNIISGARRMAIAGRQWTEIVGNDLVTDPRQFGNVSAEGNTVS